MQSLKPEPTRKTDLSVPFRSRRGPAFRQAVVVLLGVALFALAGQPVAAATLANRAHGLTHRAAVEPDNDNPHYCDGCTPPLVYMGGPILSNTPAGLTVTPIYWVPANYTLPKSYESIINGYVANVAAASGQESNVYSVDTEYYEDSGGVKSNTSYNFKAGTPIVDTHAFPKSGCHRDQGMAACIADSQLESELSRLTGQMGLATDDAHFYPVFFPENVETADQDGSTSVSDFCGYHRSFGSGPNFISYANIPYEPDDCPTGQEPNGSLVADGAVSTLSHELNEAVTDPSIKDSAWLDSSGNEIGDTCASEYGPPLGSTDPSNSGHTEYNQVINGGKYYTQEEFSVLAFAKQGPGNGCVRSESQAQDPPDPSPTQVASIFEDATPTRLPADGTSTASIRIVVGDNAGDAVANDPITFQTYARSGDGNCGKLSRYSGRTGEGGDITVTYTASTGDVECEIVAVEAYGGQSSNSIIYQGATQGEAATIHANFPTMLQAGGAPTTFTISLDNPSSEPIPATRIDFAFFPGDGTTKAVQASQLQMSYSTNGSAGPFTNVALAGDTASGDDIEGYPGPLQGSALAPHSTETFTFHLSADASTPVEQGSHALLAIEAYLDQINSATGSGTTLDDSYASQLHVAR